MQDHLPCTDGMAVNITSAGNKQGTLYINALYGHNLCGSSYEDRIILRTWFHTSHLIN
jgi:hypothetical protein